MTLRTIRSRWLQPRSSRSALLLAVTCIAVTYVSDSYVAAQVRDVNGRAENAPASTNEQGRAAIEATDADDLETLSAAEQAAALERRGRANVLGMDLEEGPNRRAVVVEVTA